MLTKLKAQSLDNQNSCGIKTVLTEKLIKVINHLQIVLLDNLDFNVH